MVLKSNDGNGRAVASSHVRLDHGRLDHDHLAHDRRVHVRDYVPNHVHARKLALSGGVLALAHAFQ